MPTDEHSEDESSDFLQAAAELDAFCRASQDDASPEVVKRVVTEAMQVYLSDLTPKELSSDESDVAAATALRDDTQHRDLLAPLSIADYDVLDQIGFGGAGTVHLALKKSTKQNVAIKFLKPSTNVRQRQRLWDEIRALGQLNHENIIRIHGVGRQGERYFLDMQLVAGVTLEELVKGLRTPVERAVQIVAAVSAAIAHAHSKDVVHRDLKPSNVLIDHSDKVFVTDFGLAAVPDSAGLGDSDTGDSIIGSPYYMAPEQAQLFPFVNSDRWGRVTKPADIYGIGAIFYALLTGSKPYGSLSPEQAIRAIASHEEQLRPVTEVYPDIPQTVANICQKCVAKHPADRFESADALHAELRKWLRESKPVHVRLRRMERMHSLENWIISQDLTFNQIAARLAEAYTVDCAAILQRTDGTWSVIGEYADSDDPWNPLLAVDAVRANINSSQPGHSAESIVGSGLYRSTICIPVTRVGHMVGAILLARHRGRPFDTYDRRSLQGMARAVADSFPEAGMISNSVWNLIESATKKFNELSDETQLIREGQLHITQMAESDRCVWLESYQQNRLIRVKDASGEKPRTFSVETIPVVSEILKNKLPVAIGNMGDDPRVGHELQRWARTEFGQHPRIGAACWIPVLTPGRDLAGILVLERYLANGDFEHARIRHCLLIADYLGAALQRAREMRWRAQFIECMRRTADCLDARVALAGLVKETTELFPDGVCLSAFVANRRPGQSEPSTIVLVGHNVEQVDDKGRSSVTFVSDAQTFDVDSELRQVLRGGARVVTVGGVAALRSVSAGAERVYVVPLSTGGAGLSGCIVAISRELAIGSSLSTRIRQHVETVAQFAEVLCRRCLMLQECVSGYWHDEGSPLRKIRTCLEIVKSSSRFNADELVELDELYENFVAKNLAWSLAVGRIVSLKPQGVDLRNAIDAAVEYVSRRYKSTVQAEMPQENLVVGAHPIALRYCLREILDNAHKFKAQGTNVFLEVTEDQDENVNVVVRNYGKFPESAESRATDLFWQGTDHFEQRIDGAGIGLWHVRVLASGQEGWDFKIGAHSGAGGMEVWAELALQRTSADTAQLIARTMPGRILIVEDIPNDREYLEEALRKEGYITYWTDASEVAWQCVAENKYVEGMSDDKLVWKEVEGGYDLLILDIDVLLDKPYGVSRREEGIRLLERIRKSDIQNRSMPVIGITGRLPDSGPTWEPRFRHAGGNEYFEKPVDVADLSERVKKLLSLERGG